MLGVTCYISNALFTFVVTKYYNKYVIKTGNITQVTILTSVTRYLSNIVTVMSLRPMKLDYQFLAQIFENLMRAGGYYSLFIIFPKAQHTSKHEDSCQKTVRSTLITLALNS